MSGILFFIFPSCEPLNSVLNKQHNKQTHWYHLGANPQTLKSTALALCYSAAEYALSRMGKVDTCGED